MTPTGKFKNFIGGTLGLFVGMSIVSVIEILIWIVQLVPNFVNSGNTTNQKISNQ